MNRRAALIFFIIFFFAGYANAWVYPEHRRIFFLALQNLSPQFRLEMDKLWLSARSGKESRLSETIINTASGRTSSLVDYASWAAISGDHSCSPADLLNTVLHSDWILRVEKITVALGDNLTQSKNNSSLINALRLSDMQLLRADDGYASRARSNDVHFLLSRSVSAMTLADYFASCNATDAAPNAMQTYAWFHTNALEKAYNYHHNTNLSAAEKSELIVSALADEAFAVHFLQDIFAAGHAAGTWGKASQKKGTHDHYNEAGLEVQTWGGKRMVIKGDAYLKEAEANEVSKVVGKSLEQFVEVVTGTRSYQPAVHSQEVSLARDSLNVCSTVLFPARLYDTSYLYEILVQTPAPGLHEGPGSLPRVNAELGPFIGVSASLNGSAIDGGFGVFQKKGGTVGGMEANLRMGLGLDGVLNRSGDGLMFVQVGLKYESASSNSLDYINGVGPAANALESAIPARASYNLRLRLPYFLVPGDLILASPLYLFAPKIYTRMAETAVNGGLLHSQSGIATPIGRFQFVLGREIGFSFYGLKNPKDFIIVPVGDTVTNLVQYRSTKIEFPFLEYVPTRTFSQNQTSNLMIQFSVGVDIPHRAELLFPVGHPLPEFKNIYYAGMRIIFNWRRYL